LALLATQVAGSNWPIRARGITGPLRPLAELPLLRDAIGNPKPLTWRWSGLVHTGKRLLDAALAPWVDEALWIPDDDPAQQIVARSQIDARAMRRRARWARRQLRAQREFFAHAPRTAKVAADQPRIRAVLGGEVAGSCITQDVFDGYSGEVCILHDASR